MARVRAARMSPPQRRRALLDAATAMVAEGGVDAARMDALAARAGVSRPVVYEHFADREQLILAVMDDVNQRVAALVVPAEEAAGPDLEAMMLAGVLAYFTAVEQIGPAVQVSSVRSVSPTIEAGRRQILARPITRWAQRYVTQAGLPVAPATALATAQLAALEATSEHWTSGLLSREQAASLHVTASLAAVVAMAAPGSPAAALRGLSRPLDSAAPEGSAAPEEV